MTFAKTKILRFALAVVVGVGCLFANEKVSLTNLESLVSEAHAIIGRPLTPMSYAGVARRTTARAVYAAPVYAAPHVYAAPAYGPRCAQVVNAYGQIVTVCR